MISGSSVVSGEGVMMAVVIGKQSQAGKHFELIFSKDDEDEDDQTPL
jgi:magnesium-transporting ATPase (P-type)